MLGSGNGGCREGKKGGKVGTKRSLSTRENSACA